MKCALSRLVAFALGAVWVLVPDPAWATLITFHSEADFLSNAPVVSTETFDEFPSPTIFFMARVVIDQVVYEVDGPCHFEGAANACWVVGIHFGLTTLTPQMTSGRPLRTGSPNTGSALDRATL
jgi:hypothetical protein